MPFDANTYVAFWSSMSSMNIFLIFHRRKTMHVIIFWTHKYIRHALWTWWRTYFLGGLCMAIYGDPTCFKGWYWSLVDFLIEAIVHCCIVPWLWDLDYSTSFFSQSARKPNGQALLKYWQSITSFNKWTRWKIHIFIHNTASSSHESFF